MKSANKASDKGKPTTVIDRSRAADINMTVLKRIDPQTEEILATAGHVCLYRMSVADQQWQRKNIEGSLFLIKRRTTPRFQMIVLNKLSTDNYIETIHGGLEIELNQPYLMYTHGNDEIHGIWFYDVADLERLGGFLQKILAQLPKPDGGAPAAAPAPAPAPVPAVPAAPSRPKGGDDAFWDKSVHVTEDTLSAGGQQLVPNSSLLSDEATSKQRSTPSNSSASGLHSLLKQAQQKHADAQRAASTSLPVPASTPDPSTPGGPPAPPSKPALLTPSFFQHQLAKQAATSTPASGSAGTSTPPPGPTPSAANGTPATSENPLQQLLSRAATKQATPSQDVSRQGAPAGPAGAGAVSPGPLPFASAAAASGGGDQQAVREQVRAALTRLVQNDSFVDTLVKEFKAVGLLQ